MNGFLRPGDNVIDTLQPDHPHSLAARGRNAGEARRLAKHNDWR